MNILVVEDEVLLASSVKEILERHDVVCAYDGLEGLELAKSSHFDLLILDIMLPKLNGFQVAKTLRAQKNGVPILMLTAKSDILDRVKGLIQVRTTILQNPLTEGNSWPVSMHCFADREKKSTR